MSEESLVNIFKTILDWHVTSSKFPAPVRQLTTGLINSTLEVYNQSMAKLLPTPTKSHYVFNLRDFARVIQVGHLTANLSSLYKTHSTLQYSCAYRLGALSDVQ